MPLTDGIAATRAAIMGDIALLSKPQQATGGAAMEIILTRIMQHIQAHAVVTTVAGQTVAVDPATHNGATTSPGSGSVA